MHTTILELNAKDDVGETLTYSLVAGYADNSKFTITGNSLKNNSAFDETVQNIYTIKVRVTDSANQTFDKIYYIFVYSLANPVSQEDINKSFQKGLVIGMTIK
jgi:hypothetical protein